jgi:DNA-binding beta-propeller fold protein YncE
MRPIRAAIPLLAALAVLVLAPAQALAARTFSESGSFDGRESPAKSFEGACGLAVDAAGDIYVADYYHHVVDVYSSGHQYLTQIAVPRTNGPCGLAVGPTGDLYVDMYHEAVERYAPSSYPPSPGTTYGASTLIDSVHPTGVAVDPASGDVYVDERTAVEVYEPNGVPLRRIELEPSADAYGVAVSDSASNEGDVYVADAATDEVLIYGPVGTLVARISGSGDPRGGFVTLADAALAVDQTSGDLLVAEDTDPGFEAPAAAVEEFGPAGEYLGELSHPLVDAVPSGLACTAQGALYVGSGNGPGASVLAFGAAGPEPLFSTAVVGTGQTALVPTSPSGAARSAPPAPDPGRLIVISSAGLLHVVSPGPGVLRVESSELAPLRRLVGSAGVSLRPQLDRRGSRALASAEASGLRVLARLRFEPAGGGAALSARARVAFRESADE